MYAWSTVTAIGFWIGALLPVVYLPVFVTGIDSVRALSLLFGLLAVHAIALILGHGHDGSRTR
ncbi:hypothetical protein GWG54_11000 [Natronococcus sp. JC468]|uniref:hypothetical protein n=1 Tax=Natronococcus sp. JC468 TaxID=1961921 RepID=UPI00143B6492|nr:hypothetical protein [Natronococcus sp. JC468]NKE36337.1 hypothetical protein [Natronococcus sp. JC468]